MAAQQGVVVVEMRGQQLNRDEANTESPTGKKVEPEKFLQLQWEFATALGVFLMLSTRLFCIYLAMPAAEYGDFRLPRTLSELCVLKDHLATFAKDYPAKFILGYCSIYIFMQTFMIPGTIFRSLLAGALFGVIRGLFWSSLMTLLVHHPVISYLSLLASLLLTDCGLRN